MKKIAILIIVFYFAGLLISCSENDNNCYVCFTFGHCYKCSGKSADERDACSVCYGTGKCFNCKGTGRINKYH